MWVFKKTKNRKNETNKFSYNFITLTNQKHSKVDKVNMF